eukprot:TRINITY_DN2103_c0_g1_i1.p1 TRINITY_DN2103_c0_g1~~TRINITY_DN2103_c0_g1_i1.p1  ORF type:complete len:706 (-),score=116.07 TRINITY_DN2103_c0_g1_i1:496-2565(-)
MASNGWTFEPAIDVQIKNTFLHAADVNIASPRRAKSDAECDYRGPPNVGAGSPTPGGTKPKSRPGKRLRDRMKVRSEARRLDKDTQTAYAETAAGRLVVIFVILSSLMTSAWLYSKRSTCNQHLELASEELYSKEQRMEEQRTMYFQALQGKEDTIKELTSNSARQLQAKAADIEELRKDYEARLVVADKELQSRDATIAELSLTHAHFTELTAERQRAMEKEIQMLQDTLHKLNQTNVHLSEEAGKQQTATDNYIEKLQADYEARMAVAGKELQSRDATIEKLSLSHAQITELTAERQRAMEKEIQMLQDTLHKLNQTNVHLSEEAGKQQTATDNYIEKLQADYEARMAVAGKELQSRDATIEKLSLSHAQITELTAEQQRAMEKEIQELQETCKDEATQEKEEMLWFRKLPGTSVKNVVFSMLIALDTGFCIQCYDALWYTKSSTRGRFTWFTCAFATIWLLSCVLSHGRRGLLALSCGAVPCLPQLLCSVVQACKPLGTRSPLLPPGPGTRVVLSSDGHHGTAIKHSPGKKVRVELDDGSVHDVNIDCLTLETTNGSDVTAMTGVCAAVVVGLPMVFLGTTAVASAIAPSSAIIVGLFFGAILRGPAGHSKPLLIGLGGAVGFGFAIWHFTIDLPAELCLCMFSGGAGMMASFDWLGTRFHWWRAQFQAELAHKPLQHEARNRIGS